MRVSVVVFRFIPVLSVRSLCWQCTAALPNLVRNEKTLYILGTQALLCCKLGKSCRYHNNKRIYEARWMQLLGEITVNQS